MNEKDKISSSIRVNGKEYIWLSCNLNSGSVEFKIWDEHNLIHESIENSMITSESVVDIIRKKQIK
jgi:hypothetical protein